MSEIKRRPWEYLRNDQKIKYLEYCNNKFHKTNVFSETGEPLYFDDNSYLIDTTMIIKLLFNFSLN